MATKRFIRVHPHSFYKIMETLKEYEREYEPIKVQNQPLSKYLLKASDYSISSAAIPNEVKIAILITYGYSNPDPSKLKDDTSMSDFNFNNLQNISLTRKLNVIARKHNPSAKTIFISSVVNCNTVKDCIDLVAKASSFAFNKIPTP